MYGGEDCDAFGQQNGSLCVRQGAAGRESAGRASGEGAACLHE
jgi:hypothetical protein